MKNTATLALTLFFLFGCKDEGTPTAPVPAIYHAPDSIAWNPSITYGEAVDERDGATYRTISLGGATWMAENLRYAAPGSMCPGNDTTFCRIFGRLYPWTTAMNVADVYVNKVYSTSSTPKQGVCPTGWHVPSATEWKLLLMAVGASSPTSRDTASFLRSLSGWMDNTNGTDRVGFRVLPAGRYNLDDQPPASLDFGTKSYFLSSTEDSRYPYIMECHMISGSEESVSYWGWGKSDATSLRCVKDR